MQLELFDDDEITPNNIEKAAMGFRVEDATFYGNEFAQWKIEELSKDRYNLVNPWYYPMELI